MGRQVGVQAGEYLEILSNGLRRLGETVSSVNHLTLLHLMLKQNELVNGCKVGCMLLFAHEQVVKPVIVFGTQRR